MCVRERKREREHETFRVEARKQVGTQAGRGRQAGRRKKGKPNDGHNEAPQRDRGRACKHETVRDALTIGGYHKSFSQCLPAEAPSKFERRTRCFMVFSTLFPHMIHHLPGWHGTHRRPEVSLTISSYSCVAMRHQPRHETADNTRNPKSTQVFVPQTYPCMGSGWG